MQYDLVKFLKRQRQFSEATFGPGDRTRGIVAHIRKELTEIEAAADRYEALEEYIDVVILALDQAWRLGFLPDEIVEALEGKYQKNMKRKWQDWRKVSNDEPIEHIREKQGINREDKSPPF